MRMNLLLIAAPLSPNRPPSIAAGRLDLAARVGTRIDGCVDYLLETFRQISRARRLVRRLIGHDVIHKRSDTPVGRAQYCVWIHIEPFLFMILPQP